MLRRLLIVIVVLGALLAGAAWWASDELQQPADNAQPVTFQVPAGASLRTALRAAQAAGVLRHPALLEWAVRWQGGAGARAGAYRVDAGITPWQLLEQLQQGRVVLEQLVVVEGWTFAQMRQAMNQHAGLTHDWRTLDDAALMRELGHAGQPAEGRFFPDTYSFAAGTSDSRIYRLAYERMQTELAQAFAARAADAPVRNQDELLILASIVERETGRADERGKVAAVFANRLRIGMRLQSDPTVIYGLGDRYDGDIRNRDLTTDTPYNTYTRAGLTPTPISLPGAAALRATAAPEASRALYFVATGLGDGTHVYSETLEQHEAAVARLVARTRRRAP